MASSEPLNILCHYCSVDAFTNIIISKQLWLSDLSKSNDALEGQVALDWLIKHLKKRGCSATHVNRVRKYFVDIVEEATCYGISFSTARDMLSQWRGYGQNGKGFSIGFSNEWLRHGTSYNTIQVIYDEENPPIGHANLIQGVVDKLIEDADGHTIRAELYGLVSEINYQIKTQFFHQEKEWRLRFSNIDSQLKYRQSNGQIVSYIEQPLFSSDEIIQPIAEVWLGPKNTHSKTEVIKFLTENGFDGFEVKLSDGLHSYR